MSLNNPQIQIVQKLTEGEDPKFFLYVTTHFTSTDFQADGQETLPEPDEGTLTVTLKVKTDGEALRLNKPVTHLVSLAGIDVDSLDRFNVVIKQGSTELATATIVYQDESETVVRPIQTV